MSQPQKDACPSKKEPSEIITIPMGWDGLDVQSKELSAWAQLVGKLTTHHDSYLLWTFLTVVTLHFGQAKFKIIIGVLVLSALRTLKGMKKE